MSAEFSSFATFPLFGKNDGGGGGVRERCRDDGDLWPLQRKEAGSAASAVVVDVVLLVVVCFFLRRSLSIIFITFLLCDDLRTWKTSPPSSE